jgi:hypothetical protein
MSGTPNKSTVVASQGLGSSQFNTLASAPAAGVVEDTGLKDLSTQIGIGYTNSMNELNSLGTAQKAGFAKVGNQITDTSNVLGTKVDSVGTQVGQVDQKVGQVGTAVTNLNTNMESGFKDTNANLNARTNALYDNQTEGFAGLAGMVNTGFQTGANQLTEYQKAIMQGQGKLNDALTASSTKQDTYYTGLAAGQTDIRGAVGGVQTGLNDFTNQYTKDAAQDLSDRKDLMAGLTNSTAMVRSDIGRTADATQRSLMQSVGGVAAAPVPSPAPAQPGTVAAPVGGFVEPGPNETVQMVNSLNNARNILTTMGDRLDPAMRNQYAELVSAFDNRGQLISQAIDQSGAFVSRMMDGQNNLIVNKFNGSGQPLGRIGFNVNQMLAAADSFGANAQPAATGFMG